jgi:hypothetical protein
MNLHIDVFQHYIRWDSLSFSRPSRKQVQCFDGWTNYRTSSQYRVCLYNGSVSKCRVFALPRQLVVLSSLGQFIARRESCPFSSHYHRVKASVKLIPSNYPMVILPQLNGSLSEVGLRPLLLNCSESLQAQRRPPKEKESVSLSMQKTRMNNPSRSRKSRLVLTRKCQVLRRGVNVAKQAEKWMSKIHNTCISLSTHSSGFLFSLNLIALTVNASVLRF